MRIYDLPTPALLVESAAFSHNVATMSERWPGTRLRPHVKAFKSTALARELAARGHSAFCAATTREVAGLVAGGLGDDVLLANEVVDRERLRPIASGGGRLTVAVDSAATIEAAAAAGVAEVLVDVDVGLMRCGCAPEEAGSLAALARRKGLSVRGVMGYEGQLMMAPAATKEAQVAEAMDPLVAAHKEVGGDVVSGGGTGTYAVNRWITELQAGSYTLMDTQYGELNLPFRQALFLWLTVISVHEGRERWAVADGGLKALGMDHGNPTVEGGVVVFCSDEHTTFVAPEGGRLPKVGERVRVLPAHIDPTIAYHERLYVVEGENVLDAWEIDLRNW
jgi:D-threonine aldolase